MSDRSLRGLSEYRARSVGVWLVAACLLLAAASLPALAQTVSVTHPANLTRLQVADETLLQVPEAGTSDPVVYDYSVTPAGRFKFYTGPNTPPGRGGNPTIVGDENLTLASKLTSADASNGYSSGFLVAVDPDSTVLTPQFIDPFAMALAQGTNTDPTQVQHFWSQTFTAGSRDISGTALIPIEVDANGNASGWVQIHVDYILVGDAVEESMVITNQGTETHTFGLRLVVDGGFGQTGVNNDGQPFFFPDGSVVTNETVIKGPFNSSNYTFTTYDPNNPKIACRGYIGDSDTAELFNPGVANFAAGMPDELDIGQLRTLGLAPYGPGSWNFTPNASASILHEDWAYAVKWNAKALAPGQSRRYVTYYGVGTSSPDYDPPFAMMAYGPIALQTAQDSSTGNYVIQDENGENPFPISCYVDNFGPAPLLNAAVRVRLPNGFDLASGSPTINLGIVPHDGLASGTWSCAAASPRPGIADFRFTGPSSRVLDAYVDIPTLPVLNPLPSSDPAFEMVSFPYVFANNAASHVLSSLGSLDPGGPATIVRYDPTVADPTQRYKFYPDPEAATINPGYGYWMLNLNHISAVMPSDRSAVSSTSAYYLPVYSGWNQVGDPFQLSVSLMSISVVDMYGRTWTMQQAIDRGLLTPTLFSWDPLNRVYDWEVDPSNVRMDPYTGYWLSVNQNLVLLIPPPTYTYTASAQSASVPTSSPAPADSWHMTLVATTANAGSEHVTMGAAASAKDGWDALDLPAPPEPAGLREARVTADIMGPNNTPCLSDFLSKAHSQYQWSFQVATNQVSTPVTLNWPDLSKLPSDLVPTLVDLETGTRTYLRTAPGYTYTSSAIGQPHQFQLVVTSRSTVGAMITTAQVSSGGRGATVAYTLAAPANVTVTVRNIAGLVVRQLTTDQTDAAGVNQVTWNGTSDRGTPVPGGRYLIQITARSADTGQSYQVVRALQLGR